jgi:hypothetical protein
MGKRKCPLGLKSYTESFKHDGKTWSVVHKTKDLIYAVEVNKKGIAGGGIERFPC